ncbi:MAG: nucleoside hydrolase [Candidatus Kerfeldbacteria bacterium]|nr:nucleoside hydrolase [Candidatus Kerfeldbacteria bacterium]
MKHTFVTDPGVDDVIALLLHEKLFPNERHSLVATFGNLPIEYTGKNLQECIAAFAPKSVYVQGSQQPTTPLVHPWADYYHGSDGVWNSHPAVDTKNVQSVSRPEENPCLISVGPMTDVAKITRNYPLESLYIMGGAFNVRGNETEYAETNIAFDPGAAQETLNNTPSTETYIIPLDVTNNVFWTKEQVKMIPEDSMVNIWIRKMLMAWFAGYGDKKNAHFYLYDPLAILSMKYPEMLQWTQSGVRIELSGERRGQTVLDTTSRPLRNVALSVAPNAQPAELIFTLLFQDYGKNS